MAFRVTKCLSACGRALITSSVNHATVNPSLTGRYAFTRCMSSAGKLYQDNYYMTNK